MFLTWMNPLWSVTTFLTGIDLKFLLDTEAQIHEDIKNIANAACA